MKRRTPLIVAATGLIVLAAFAAEDPKPSYKPKDGYVPDAKTAIKIAVAVWEPIYGEKLIANEKPYHANLSNGVWTVTGSLPKGALGGTAIADIAKDNGRILRVIHEK